tara:strand:- start:2756 stop:2989 length:234 start_codon:yes stop_codon:yes gene_type:complete
MAKIIRFPTRFEGLDIDRSSIRVKALEQRVGTLEQRIAHYSDEMMFLKQQAAEDEFELNEVLNELAIIKGFKEELCE